MEDVSLREFVWEKDYGRVLEFQEDLYKTNYPNFIASYSFFKEIEKKIWVASKSKNSHLIVAEKDKRVIGFIWVEYMDDKDINFRNGIINQLYIVPRWRNSGIGMMLLNEGENFLRINNVKKTKLHVSATNIEAYKLYNKIGFQPIRILMEKDY